MRPVSFLPLVSVVTACLPAVEVTGGEAGAGGTAGSAGSSSEIDDVGAGLFRYVVDDCQAAVESACGPELLACSDDRECDDYFACWFHCEPPDLDCRADCNRGTLRDAEIALRHCVARNALHECTTETLHFDRRGATCAQCAAGCEIELQACLASEGCARLLGCEATNPSLLPSECERRIPEEDLTPAALQFKDLVDACVFPASGTGQTGCRHDCNEAWGCVGEFEHPVDESWGAVTGTIVAGTLVPDPSSIIEITFTVSGVQFVPFLNQSFKVDACRKDDTLCRTPLQTVMATHTIPVQFDKSLIGTPIGFDGFFLIEGDIVYPGRLQGMMPKVAGVPGNTQATLVAANDSLETGIKTIPDFNSNALFVAGSIADCGGLLASGVTVTASSGRVFYLDDNVLPDLDGRATNDRGLYVVVDLAAGPLTLTAHRDGRIVSETNVLMQNGRYSGVNMIPQPRSER